jgi:nucleoid-associated protein YejK
MPERCGGQWTVALTVRNRKTMAEHDFELRIKGELTFAAFAREAGSLLDAVLERSQSGDGGHAVVRQKPCDDR